MMAVACSDESHERLKLNEAAWYALPFVGIQETHGCGECLELRNCRCNSTLARPLAHSLVRRRLYELVAPDGRIVIRIAGTGEQALGANLRLAERETGYHWRPVPLSKEAG